MIEPFLLALHFTFWDFMKIIFYQNHILYSYFDQQFLQDSLGFF